LKGGEKGRGGKGRKGNNLLLAGRGRTLEERDMGVCEEMHFAKE
jgi:hypothetical protein